jgi:hypothetical protein
MSSQYNINSLCQHFVFNFHCVNILLTRDFDYVNTLLALNFEHIVKIIGEGLSDLRSLKLVG